MDQRDQELLDKQLRRLSPSPRNDGVMIFTFVVMFLAGVTLGSILFSHQREPMQTASNDTAAIALLNGAPKIARP
jgi:hypothetical protein